MSDEREQRAARQAVGFAAAGTSWALAHALGLLGPLADQTFMLLGLAALAATVLGVRRFRPARVWPFAVITLALLCFLVGGSMRIELDTIGDVGHSRALAPDLATLPGYLLFGAGIAGFARARRGSRRLDPDVALDGAVASLAALAVAWAYLITPALDKTDAPLHVRLVLAAYPPMSVFLVALTAQIAFVAGSRRPTAHRLLVVALCTMLVGDVLYMLADAHIATVPAKLLDFPYALAYVAFATSVLHPSMRELVEPVPRVDRTPRSARLAVVSLSLAIPVVIVLLQSDNKAGERNVLAVVVLALTAAAVCRVFRALRAHARSEQRLVHQATHDSLTGLPNRVFLEDYVENLLARQRGTDRLLALLFLDVDRFKVVNDSMGHGLGDDLLVAVGKRLRGVVPRDNVVVRLGGDEFVVVLESFSRPDEARYVAESVRACFAVPFTVRDAEIYASVSVGVAIASPGDRVTVESLLRDADTAMYQAKDAGRDAVAVFDARMRDDVARRVALERDLRNALRAGELSLHYQPIIDVRTRRVIGFEALLRWSHAELGHIPPIAFIPIAEETGLIVPIGRWVVDTACEQIARWRRELREDLFVSVNLSARQLRDRTLLATILATLDRHRLDPSGLRLELTESMLLEDAGVDFETLEHIRARGVRIAIDDFGTGYSSLAYLRRLPIDDVKIDKSFIDDLDRPDSADASLVAAIVALASALDMTTTAEGVETPGQADVLRALGVDAAQGYVFARPMPVEQVADAVRRLGQLAEAPPRVAAYEAG
jgi:diguanylate cyclase (GGDEF)-like protein